MSAPADFSKFEFGAHQYGTNLECDLAYFSCIPHFFALKKASNYLAFDPSGKKEFEKTISALKRLKKTGKEYDPDTGTDRLAYLENYGNLHPDKLKQAVFSISADSYEKMICRIKDAVEKDKKPIIFSNYVLSGPNLKMNHRFWTLPAGLHFHSGAIEKMVETTQPELKDRAEKEAKKEGKSHYNLIPRRYARYIKEDPKKHMKKFSEYFSIDAKVRMLLPDDNEVVFYFW